MASFDENGKYIKTNWKAGDKITATKLNKIEESIEAVNDNDISRHVEADARLDALEAKDVAHDKEFTNVKNLIEDAKDAAELGDYEINSRMQFLEDDVEQAVNDMNNAVTTIRNEMNTHTNTVNANVDNKISAFETEFDAEVAGLKAIDETIQNDVSVLQNDVSVLQNDVIEIQNDVIEIQNDVSEIQNDVSEIQNDVSAIQNDMTEYLPLSGGELTGEIKLPLMSISNDTPGINADMHFNFDPTKQNPRLRIGGTDSDTFEIQGTGDTVILRLTQSSATMDTRNLQPLENGVFRLGGSDNRWQCLYSKPFDMIVEENGYTSRLKCNRGNFRLVDGYSTTILSWSHDHCIVGPDATNQINLGSENFRFKSLYLNAQPNVSSDRTLKENIKYVNSDESNVSYEDMYAFIKDDLELATYNLVEHEKLNMGFIAQDLLVNLDGTDNKVGQMIVNPVPVPTEEEIAEGKPYPTLSYDMGMYTSVLAGALKEAINKIEQLEARINELENK